MIGGCQHQHAGEIAADIGLVGGREFEDQPVLGESHGLGRGTFDDAAFQRKESRVHRMRRRQRGRFSIKRDGRVSGISQLPRRRHRQLGAGVGKVFRHRRISRAVADLHRQGQGGVFRNADILADQEMGGAFQGDAVAHLGVGGHGDIAEQRDLALIAKVHERADRQAFGRGPLERARAPARGGPRELIYGPVFADAGLFLVFGTRKAGEVQGQDMCAVRGYRRGMRF